MISINIIAVLGACLISISSGSEVTIKRGLFDDHFGYGYQQNDLNYGPPVAPASYPNGGISGGFYNKALQPGISPAEIAAAISAAKEASSQVHAAQHRVNLAKESVLHQQRIASHKEHQAALALQRTEAAAAVQRQEANSAATAVVLAQQRLAHAKADVAEQQRIAATKESQAAEIIQRSAAAAAAEIQRTEQTAAKIAAFQGTQSNAFKHLAASKDATLSAAAAAVGASINGPYAGQGPWYGPPKIISFPGWN